MNNQDKMHVLARGVIIDGDKILLCRNVERNTEFYFLPGGHVEHKESVRDALVREMKEETGHDFYIKRFLGCLEYSFECEQKKAMCHDHEYNFVFEMGSDAIKSHNTMVCPEDHIELTWESLDQLDKIKLRPEPLKRLLPLWLEEEVAHTFMSEMD